MLGGLLLTLVGAKHLVAGAVNMASALGFSEAVIGLTVVAVGTSLPELATSVVAARKGRVDVAFGNLVGSNFFNILGILGVTALVQPIMIPDTITVLYLLVMLAATGAVILLAMRFGRVACGTGSAFLLAYFAYLSRLIVGS